MTATPLLLANARVIDPARDLDAPGAVLLVDGRIAAAGPEALNQGAPEGTEILDVEGAVVAPGLVDMGVTVGEPGAEHRETLASASLAAAAGGITTIVTAPGTDPVIDDPALVDFVLRRARDTACVRVHPMAALTKGLQGTEMSEIGLLKEAGAVAFSNGSRSITHAGIMRRLMTYARDFDALVVHHTEDPDLTGAGVLNEGLNASWKGLPAAPREAEIIMLERDLRLVALTGARYHAAALSCADSAEAIRAAKRAGRDVTAAISINHLTLNENDIGPYRTFFKMKPPLRSEDDRQAMVEGVATGDIDVIVSAHDPRGAEGKRRPFAEANDGAVGLETMLGAGLRLYHNGQITLHRLLNALAARPAELLGLAGGRLVKGAPADLVLIDLEMPWLVAREELRSKSTNTPFDEARFEGRALVTFVSGRPVYHYG